MRIRLKRVSEEPTMSTQQQGEVSGIPAMPHVQIDGTVLAYVDQGSGTPVVFVHGSIADYRTWNLQVATFSKHYRVIAYSRRHHWPNDPPDADDIYRFTNHVDDLGALIEDLEVAPAHVVASSYGALITLALALKRPELMRSMVISEPPLIPWLEDLPGGAEVARSFIEGVVRPAAEAMARGRVEEGVRLMINGIAGGEIFYAIPLDLMDNAAALRLELTGPLEEFFPYIDREAIKRIAVPTLLLQGGASAPWFTMVMDELARLMPGSGTVIFRGANHVPHLQDPTAHDETVFAFLADH
jgi:pimeloyl-ACP methyl ester carboxylesterase